MDMENKINGNYIDVFKEKIESQSTEQLIKSMEKLFSLNFKLNRLIAEYWDTIKKRFGEDTSKLILEE